MTATRIDPRPQQVPPYRPTSAEQRHRNLRALAKVRAALTPPTDVDPAYRNTITALAKTHHRVTTNQPTRSTDR